MSRKRHPIAARPSGAALIMALLVVALVTSLASTLIWRQDLWLRQVETHRDIAQTRVLVTAGIEWARAVLAEDARTSTTDHLGEPWATKVPAMPAEHGEISGELLDEQSKWNLNNLSRAGRISAADAAIFRRLLELLQLPQGLSSTLSDWLDADSDADPEGAEDAYYLGLKPAYRSANRELSNLDSLLRVRGFNRDVIERLRPYVTVLPGYNPVNVNTTNAIVLSAVFPALPAAEVQQLITERDRIPIRDSADFIARLPRPELATMPGIKEIDKRSLFFSVVIHARYGNAEISSTALLDRHTIWPTLVWQNFE